MVGERERVVLVVLVRDAMEVLDSMFMMLDIIKDSEDI